ncbi:discoidin domain-containing protein [Streptomyces sp. NPDC005181]|uniref:discoidin domain-containing protein n=1 Tax=Streptomyces sp. NPDC005181 TaxID=3156869 RepID=UPI0033BD916B
MTDEAKTAPGPNRRTVLEVGVSGAVLAATAGLPLMAAGPAAAAGATASGRLPAAGSWHRYVQGPSGRTVRPVRIVRSDGDVTRPDALLRPGGKLTVLRRAQPPAAPRWPEGTTTEASSTHAGNNGNDGRPRTYEAKNAVDGDLGTFWNDDTERDFPDTLSITTPEERELSGLTVVSSPDGVPTAFTVAVWADSAWKTVATVTGNSTVQRAVRFDAPVSTARVRVTVTAAQDLGRGVFTRINEVWPEAVDPVVAPSVTLDFGKVVVGYPKVDFAWASDNRPGVRLDE